VRCRDPWGGQAAHFLAKSGWTGDMTPRVDRARATCHGEQPARCISVIHQYITAASWIENLARERRATAFRTRLARV
jgi:hypothetical protein